MSRRVSLPGAAELFGTDTKTAKPKPEKTSAKVPTRQAKQKETVASGRVKHDEKITVYLSSEELLALEQARLKLRGEYGLPADRGRIVRAAITQALCEFSESGINSKLVQKLSE